MGGGVGVGFNYGFDYDPFICRAVSGWRFQPVYFNWVGFGQDMTYCIKGLNSKPNPNLTPATHSWTVICSSLNGVFLLQWF